MVGGPENLVILPAKKLEDLIRLAELCVDLLRLNEEFYAEVKFCDPDPETETEFSTFFRFRIFFLHGAKESIGEDRAYRKKWGSVISSWQHCLASRRNLLSMRRNFILVKALSF